MPSPHIHNEAVEGPLPEGFPVEGREGKVRNIYEMGGRICLIASDRVSAFDQVSPTPVPGKGEILNDIARQELLAAEATGIPTWFEYVPEENPRAAVGIKTQVLPIEMIFRNVMTGSMWREYQATGDFVGFGLPPDLQEFHAFDSPLFTPSTKSKKDDNFNPKDVIRMIGIDPWRLEEMVEIGHELFKLGTERAADLGLLLADTKYEMGYTQADEILVIDEVHTPDSSRFVIAEGFKELVEAGKRPRHLSKEFLREIKLGQAGGDPERAKELMAQPLSDEEVEGLIDSYSELHRLFTRR